MQEVSDNFDCFGTSETIAQEATTCCSSYGISNSNSEIITKCDDLHNTCTVCNSEIFITIDNKDAILVNNISSIFKVSLRDKQLFLTNDDIDDSKKTTFLKFLKINNLSYNTGKDILILNHKLKILLPALA
ncbi:MAG: hypothetical protein GY936_07560 [Ignavibacteriae bacterium]|nr:hypothetical protein [Ignavibacteriota bacterium]